MGWFNCVASRYGCRLQGTTQVAFTVLDVLGYLDEIPVCIGYETDGVVIRELPQNCRKYVEFIEQDRLSNYNDQQWTWKRRYYLPGSRHLILMCFRCTE